MNSKGTWTLVAAAAGVFALVYFVERPYRLAREAAQSRILFGQLNPSGVTGIQVRPANQLEIRAASTNADWQLIRPIYYPADRQKIEGLLQAISRLSWAAHISAGDLQDRPNALAEFGFDPPQFSISIENVRRPLHFLIGKKTPTEDLVYLQVVGGDGIYLVDADILKKIPGAPNEWRDTTVFQLGGLGIDALQITNGDRKSFELRFDATNHVWRMLKPQEARADNSKIALLLQDLQRLQVARFVSDDPKADLDVFGLQTPSLELAFSRDTNLLTGLVVGKSPTNAPTLIYAKRLNEPSIFLVPKEPLEPWRASQADFRDRHLLSEDAGAVGRIETRGAEKFVLQREGSNAWRVVSPGALPADPVLMHQFLTNLTRMEVELEKSVVTDFGAYGLTNPVVEYDVRVAGAGTVSNAASGVQLAFGTNQGKIFARRSDEISVYLVNAENFFRLPSASWQLRDRRIFHFDSSDVLGITIRQKGRERKLIRNGKGEWIQTIGDAFVNSFKMEEALHRIGELQAVWWTARGDGALERFGFPEVDHHLVFDLKKDGKMEKVSLDFGQSSEYLNPYASTVLDGERMIFEFPVTNYFNFVRDDLTIPAGTAAPPR